MDMAATMDDAVKLRTQLVKEWEGIAKPTFTDLVIRAVAKALREHPQMNSQFQTDAIELLQEVHVELRRSTRGTARSRDSECRSAHPPRDRD